MPRTKMDRILNNPTQQIAEAINEPESRDIMEVAQDLGIAEPDLRDRLEEKLQDSSMQRVDLLVIADERITKALEAIKTDLVSEKSVRPLAQSTLPQIEAQTISPTPEPEQSTLTVEDQPKKQRRKSTALTKKQKEAVDALTQQEELIDQGIEEEEIDLAIKEGIQKGVNLVRAEEGAKVGTVIELKGKLAKRKRAYYQGKAAQRSGFDLNATLAKHGIDPAKTMAEMQQESADTSDLLGKASGEMKDNAWSNGHDYSTSSTDLRSLLSDE